MKHKLKIKSVARPMMQPEITGDMIDLTGLERKEFASMMGLHYSTLAGKIGGFNAFKEREILVAREILARYGVKT